MAARQSAATDREIVARYRRGWTLFKAKNGRHYLRRNFGGQYEVTVKRDGFASWLIRDLEGNRVYPERLR